MPVIRETLFNKSQTGKRMHKIIYDFYGDLGDMAKWPIQKFFDYVKNIPYQRDKHGTEIIARPRILISEFFQMDCKKKAILISSWLRANKIPYRLLAVSEIPSGRIHHVFPQGYFGDKWENVDATYSKFYLFQKKPKLTKVEILRGD